MILPVIWEVEHCGDLGALCTVSQRAAPSGKPVLLRCWRGCPHGRRAEKFCCGWRTLIPPAVPLKYGAQTERDLQWLGLDWDIGPGKENGTGPYYQSRRTALYQAALEKLEDRGLVYPCFWHPGGAARSLGSPPGGRADSLCRHLPVFNSGGDRGEAPDSCARSAAAGVGGGLGLHGRTHGPL